VIKKKLIHADDNLQEFIIIKRLFDRQEDLVRFENGFGFKSFTMIV